MALILFKVSTSIQLYFYIEFVLFKFKRFGINVPFIKEKYFIEKNRNILKHVDNDRNCL